MELKTIKNLMDKLAKDDMVFSNEQEFQFELALRLRRLRNVRVVKLEALSLKGYKNWNEVKNAEKIKRNNKEYTDIIVTEKGGTNTAIELKYKTPEKVCFYETKNGPAVTLGQGANDLGSYDFIEDIHRLETINDRLLQCEKGVVSKAFAIILTNDSKYRYDDFSSSKFMFNYGINEKRLTIPAKTLTFEDGENKHVTHSETLTALKLLSPASLERWNNYKLPNPDYDDYEDKAKSQNPGFSYLIVEVEPKK